MPSTSVPLPYASRCTCQSVDLHPKPSPPGDNIMTLIINGWEYRMYTADASMRKNYDGAQSYCKGLGDGWDLVPYNDDKGYGEPRAACAVALLALTLCGQHLWLWASGWSRA